MSLHETPSLESSYAELLQITKDRHWQADIEVEYSLLRLSQYRRWFRTIRIVLCVLAVVAAIGGTYFGWVMRDVGWNWLAALVTLISTMLLPATGLQTGIKNLEINRFAWEGVLFDYANLIDDLKTGMPVPEGHKRLQQIRTRETAAINFDTQVPLCEKTRTRACDLADKRCGATWPASESKTD